MHIFKYIYIYRERERESEREREREREIQRQRERQAQIHKLRASILKNTYLEEEILLYLMKLSLFQLMTN